MNDKFNDQKEIQIIKNNEIHKKEEIIKNEIIKEKEEENIKMRK